MDITLPDGLGMFFELTDLQNNGPSRGVSKEEAWCFRVLRFNLF